MGIDHACIECSSVSCVAAVDHVADSLEPGAVSSANFNTTEPPCSACTVLYQANLPEKPNSCQICLVREYSWMLATEHILTCFCRISAGSRGQSCLHVEDTLFAYYRIALVCVPHTCRHKGRHVLCPEVWTFLSLEG